jgi:hypothetical protein
MPRHARDALLLNVQEALLILCRSDCDQEAVDVVTAKLVELLEKAGGQAES